MSERLRLKFDAFAVAMRAKIGEHDVTETDELLARAEETLTSDDPLFRAITAFVVAMETATGPAGRLEPGHVLHDALEGINVPVPPDLHRRDIHG